MKVLVDTNVMLDFVQKRDNYFEPAKKIFEQIMQKNLDGYAAFHSIPTVWYILGKKQIAEKRKIITLLCSFLTVISAPHSEVVKSALDDSFQDFEDRLQVACAKTARADFIITRNIKDYKNSSVKAILPEEFIKINHI